MAAEKFKLGITMAGAVSAGAFTAGVIDYLLQSLSLWEQAKQRNREIGEGNPGYDPSIPMYDVVISVLSGASAGGITAVVTTAAVQEPIPHVTPDKRFDHDWKAQNKFYDTWVNMLQNNMMLELLDNSDITADGVTALLNSQFKDALADKVMVLKGEPKPPPYISKNLEVLLTLSNLEGLPFSLGFNAVGDKGNYYTRWQRDFGHFIIGHEDYAGNGRIPVSFSSGIHLEQMKEAAKATGAFPVGLKSRTFKRHRKFVEDNPFINPLHGYIKSLKLPEEYTTLNVDGGLLNNEPFDITRRIMFNSEDFESQKRHDTFEGTILMIDPFPSEEPHIKFGNHSPLLKEVLPKIFDTMRSQLLFKEQDLEAAFDDNDFSRFLIAPKREKLIGSEAIACGSLGGFGGFFSKVFREHDFFLGRRNCQHFLRTYLGVPASTQNPIFKGKFNDEAVERFGFLRNGATMLPLIPDMNYRLNGQSSIEDPLPFPKISSADLHGLRPAMNERVRRILIGFAIDRLMPRWVFNLIFRWKGRKISNFLLESIAKDLRGHGLMD